MPEAPGLVPEPPGAVPPFELVPGLDVPALVASEFAVLGVRVLELWLPEPPELEPGVPEFWS